LARNNIEIHLIFTWHNNLFLLSPTIEQACNVQGASWVKRKNMCMWIAKAFQAFALGDAWKKFAQLD
jgi:hypothetical protein